MDKLQGSPVKSGHKIHGRFCVQMGGSYGFTIVVIDHPHVVFMVGINSKGS